MNTINYQRVYEAQQLYFSLLKIYQTSRFFRDDRRLLRVLNRARERFYRRDLMYQRSINHRY